MTGPIIWHLYSQQMAAATMAKLARELSRAAGGFPLPPGLSCGWCWPKSDRPTIWHICWPRQLVSRRSSMRWPKPLPGDDCRLESAGGTAETLRPLFASPDQPLEAAAIGLAGAWKLQPLAADIRRLLDQSSGSAIVTVAAIGAIARIDGLAALPLFTRLLTPEHPATIRAAAIRATCSLDLPLAARLAAEQIGSLDDEGAMSAWLLPIVERQEGAKLLAAALSTVSLSPDTAKLAHRALTAAGQADPQLMTVLNKSLGIVPLSAEYSPQRVAQLAEGVRTAGNASRGREVFLSKLANCTACYKVAGQGKRRHRARAVGRQLRAVPLPLIIESILWPNRQVKEGICSHANRHVRWADLYRLQIERRRA